MNQQQQPCTCPPMRWWLTAWLTAPYRALTPEGEAELRAILFSRMLTLLISAVVTIVIEALALAHHPTRPFVMWLWLDAGLLFWVRLALIATIIRYRARHPLLAAPPSVVSDGFVLAGLVWCALLGLGAGMCVATGDFGLGVMGALLAMATAGAQCGRLPGAPRLATMQILLIVVPAMPGCWLAPDHFARWAILLSPLYVVGLISINGSLHREFVEMVVGRQENRRLALRCPLTGLPNRRMFDRSLARMVQGAAARADVFVLCLDLDGFKMVNDRLGHMTGDLLLKEVGVRLARQVPEDGLAARVGGDEFAIVVGAGTAESVAAMARAIVASLREPFLLADDAVRVGVSIGIARRQAGQDAGRLVDEADRALYAAKRAGKNTFRWAEAPDAPETQDRLRRSGDDALRGLRPVMAAPRPPCGPVGNPGGGKVAAPGV